MHARTRIAGLNVQWTVLSFIQTHPVLSGIKPVYNHLFYVDVSIKPVHQCLLYQETGVTSFMLAVRDNKIVIAERLIDLGAHINGKAKVGAIIISKS